MKKVRSLSLLITFFSLAFSVTCNAGAVLSRIKNESNSDEIRIRMVMDVSAAETPSSFWLENPVRLVVDFPGARLAFAREEFPVPGPGSGETLLLGIRVGQFATDTARVVVELEKTADHVLRPAPDGTSYMLIIARDGKILEKPPEPIRPVINPPSGITYKMEKRMREHGPLIYHIMDIDMSKNAYSLDVAMAKDTFSAREPLSSMASRKGAVAAINGGYFILKSGEPVDMLVINGKLLANPERYRSFFGISVNNAPVIVMPTFSMSVTVGNGNPIKITRLNRDPENPDPVVFTSDYGNSTRTQDRYEYIVQNGRISASSMGNSNIPDHGFVLSIGPKYHEYMTQRINVGDTANLNIFSYPDFGGLKGGFTAGPMLIDNGDPAPYQNEEFGKSGITSGRHPRTAACMTHHNHLRFVVAEGRSDYSIGLTIPELIEIMQSLGCISAINLDGGGSSEMIINGKIANLTSGGSERPLSNAILIFSNN